MWRVATKAPRCSCNLKCTLFGEAGCIMGAVGPLTGSAGSKSNWRNLKNKFWTKGPRRNDHTLVKATICKWDFGYIYCNMQIFWKVITQPIELGLGSVLELGQINFPISFLGGGVGGWPREWPQFSKWSTKVKWVVCRPPHRSQLFSTWPKFFLKRLKS